ncbi:NAD-dependent epimerase/dehydratase [Candidatus Propionivibrio aalborgensis]|uniref:NAD-dependent epimerase/dehydratase n=1 Tax=Candidatus Propionivibrio aalborgensis TaxID=1860101 RepID=A0A1A8XZ69_9RHOO|nr:NAD-dependent epimerase/dehydratase family protein [Candidatus Propionivibrio aalborgensis]SBT09363.1 NAD-dependent epimerase/dehydratase [Candidatus Propionivibrio aalborgensis]
MKVCVIGGGGFIGQWLVRQLLSREDAAIVIGRSPRPLGLPAEVEYIRTAYDARDALVEVLTRVDAIVHLAYATVPSTSFSDPIHDLIANVSPTVTLFQQVAAAGVGRFVLVSSGGTVYGNAASLPILEGAPTNPISPYGITKLTIERYAQMYHALQGLPVVIVRPGNAYGARCDGGMGGGFVTAAVRAAACGQPLQIYGDGSVVRDYVHVSDVAAGIVASLTEGVVGATYNIGTGIGYSNNDILRLAGIVTGQDQSHTVVRYLPLRGFDVAANVLDATLLNKATGWMPKMSIEAGIDELRRACVCPVVS